MKITQTILSATGFLLIYFGLKINSRWLVISGILFASIDVT